MRLQLLAPILTANRPVAGCPGCRQTSPQLVLFYTTLFHNLAPSFGPNAACLDVDLDTATEMIIDERRAAVLVDL